jgi:triacylglycerol esterase/lipase EstA (alpha/beta hydrolase family)
MSIEPTARPPRPSPPDTRPHRPRHPRPLRFRLLLAGLSLTLLAVVAPPGTGSANAQVAADPIVFVHGWNSSATTWNTMIDRFVAAGYPRSRMLAITYNSNQSNGTIANQVRDAVNALRSQTGAARVDIISHSMGGLSSRYYLKNLGGSSVVDDWVSLGGPNHGTNFAYACYLFSAGCRDMIGGSGFLNALNSGDETPGATNYGTFWSSCDEIINPDNSVLLNGATNIAAGCLGHSELTSNAGVFDQVRAFVA